MITEADRQLATRRTAVDAACRRHGVERLELFGSGATGKFRSEASDLDFLVEFLPPATSHGGLFNRYFGLKDELQELFGRSVDLVMTGALRNPYFIESVNKARRVVFTVA